MTPERRSLPLGLSAHIVAVFVALLLLLLTGPVRAQTPVLPQFLAELPAGDLVAGADAFGPMRDDMPVAPVMQGGQQLGWAFITSDFVGTTGYSGKPIHTMVAVDDAARVIGVKLVKHSEPIVLIGIPNSRMEEMAAGYVGLDLVAEAAAGGSAHDLNIISGATVTVMVIDDNIVRAGLRVARALGLGGLGADAAEAAPPRELAADAAPVTDWAEAEGDGTVRRLMLTVGEVNEAYDAHDDLRAAARPLPNDPETVFIDMQAALVSVPAIGQPILGPAEYANVESWLDQGDSAVAIAGLGLYSFKGSGYVRGGIFDRIQLIQDDISVRFRDRQHRRTTIALTGAPAFTEMDLFRIPADSGFDPARPFRIQLLVHRDVSALEKAFLTYDLGYQLPERYLTPLPPPEAAPVAAPSAPAAMADTDEASAQAALWKRAWDAKRPQIAIVAIMLGVLTAAFFFQEYLSRSERAVRVFRLSFLTVTLVVLGWMWNAQLSVVNIFALFASMREGFSWQAFLMDPLTFILWFGVAAALIFWGRGAYCGWLCPFGALQELTNQIGRKLRIPQITVPWFIHERAWAVKYMIFLGLFGVSLASLEQAEHLAEVEPFKTAIILNFQRSWPFLLYVGALLVAGLFIERFFCRYLCPLGAALAIPARIRMFDWLKRYKECGNPCQTCGNECFVQAIHPEGPINPNECLNCMHCQVLYHSEKKCPVVIKRLKRRKTIADSGVPDLTPRAGLSNHPNLQAKGI
ncbi:MAG: 4Fe-4S binding protein [Paracoccus sp. (in: a-proteobacteria)]|uniref:NosR/NirI family protein n=1 Tax=Paracoccus sp. TaxID=267 RepID=UPI0026DF9613|nr:NosR/NirI family protein [Paracoccus sp. (in: a-proteobacteria)]MDO5614430.1 4Fe-4S binding protein [Paracoccus sp. (in: a-proteobacteria)]